MIYNFGKNIKALRKGRNLTQEQLAERLNVSSQAVSKWETDCSYPDITLLPIIASYFEISIDALIGYDLSKISKEIEKIVNDSDTFLNEEKYPEAISVLRIGLTKYPANDTLMYRLAWALSHCVGTENYDEAIQLYLKIIEISKDITIKTKATKDLVYRYYTKNKIELALKYAEKLPSFDVCREYNIGRSNILNGKNLSDYLQSNIKLYGKAMLECLEYFTSDNILNDKEKLPFTAQDAKTKIVKLKEIID